MPFIRSISGLRATIDDGLTKEIVAQYSRAFAQFAQSGPIVIGRDGRPSGLWMEQVIADTLRDCGREVQLLGLAPTPTVQLITEHSNAGGGISITASHNPKEWNGMKFLDEHGVFLDADQNKEFWQIVDANNLSSTQKDKGSIYHLQDAIPKHIHAVLQALHNLGLNNCESGSSLDIVIDAVNASGSVIVPELVRAFHCNPIELYCDSSGDFPHTPEPLPEHLTALAEAVKNHKADLGIAVDPDADRLVLIDEQGIAIGEEKTIALAIMAIGHCANSKHENTSAVVNLSTSRMSDDIAAKYSMPTYRSPVGEINVVKAMKQYNSIIGGEGSGGVILPACHYGRDSLVGIALIITLMRTTKKTLSQLSTELASLTMVKGKLPWQKDTASLFGMLKESFANEAQLIREDDGIWIDFGSSWLHVRASNTEPIVRYIVESQDAALNSEILKKVSEIITSNS